MVSVMSRHCSNLDPLAEQSRFLEFIQERQSYRCHTGETKGVRGKRTEEKKKLRLFVASGKKGSGRRCTQSLQGEDVRGGKVSSAGQAGPVASCWGKGQKRAGEPRQVFNQNSYQLNLAWRKIAKLRAQLVLMQLMLSGNNVQSHRRCCTVFQTLCIWLLGNAINVNAHKMMTLVKPQHCKRSTIQFEFYSYCQNS